MLAVRLVLLSALVTLSGATAVAQTATQTKPFEPYQGQPGKDVVWVPTDQRLVDKMLDMAKVTPQDFLMDLGSGDGRTVITAAKRGLRAQGIEYNPDMVALSKRNATAAGVTERAQFVQADIFETDFSKATVLTLFLLPQLNLRLRPTILNMKPGTRVVSNSFNMAEWEADQTETIPNCSVSFCTAMLWIVPAKVAGNWQLGTDTLTLDQNFQMVSGKLGSAVLSEGKLNGADITFTAGGKKYTGKVDGNSMSGTIAGGGSWTAKKS
jgi:Predicted O-methyltransferase